MAEARLVACLRQHADCLLSRYVIILLIELVDDRLIPQQVSINGTQKGVADLDNVRIVAVVRHCGRVALTLLLAFLQLSSHHRAGQSMAWNWQPSQPVD